MAVKKSGLGKGLDSLIPPVKAGQERTFPKKSAETDFTAAKDTEKNADGAVLMKLSLIEPNREQPRKLFDEDLLLELAESIRQYGVLQPLLVTKKDGYYELIAGERRWRAAKLAGLREVPVIVREYTPQEIVEISLIENIQREDLNPIEEAQAYKRLLEEFHLKQDEIAERVSKSRTAVTNMMRLLKLSQRVQEMLIEEMISAGHARALLAVEDEKLQETLANEIFEKKLSVRETEKLVKALTKPEKAETEKPRESEAEALAYRQIEEKMKGWLGTKVSISHKNKNKGKIEIEYYSQDELERLIELFGSMG